ncbi:MAG: hydrogenase maturation protease [Planctomycetaceae bacterium]|nr:hydrogenase maturation protease [Planctomycetaceae bacterium]
MTERAPRILVAGLGNVFLGDDAFGVEVARRLLARPPVANIRVVDFGIAGIDLIYTLLEGFDLVILVDAVARGGPPGALYVIKPDMQGTSDELPAFDPHDMDPAKVLAWVASMPQTVARVLLVGCEIAPPGRHDLSEGLSPAVRDAVEPAADLIQRLAAQPLNVAQPFHAVAPS